jgi:FkbM family methyltransferase
MSFGNINNFPQSTKILRLNQPFVLIDVGARRGFHPVFNNFIPSKKIGFEPNKEECSFLNTNKSGKSECYFPVGLGSKYEERKFYNAKNPGSSGIFPPNKEYWSRFTDSNSLDVVSEDTIKTEPLDSFLHENGIQDCDFIKIDTEGFEKHIIHGGKKIITENVLGVLCEVYFNPVRKGGAKFGDIHNILDVCGLSLYELSPSKICKKGFFLDKKNTINADSIGQLVWGDAVFLRDPLKVVNAGSFEWDLEKYKKLLSLYEIFNLDDCAYELVCHLEDKDMLTFAEIKALKKVFLHKAFKVRSFNFIYNHLPFLLGLLPNKLKKLLRKLI